MNWVNGIQNAINYMEEHLTENIDYDKIAKEAAASSFYFQKIFSILCGYSVGEYITCTGKKSRIKAKNIFSLICKFIVERR